MRLEKTVAILTLARALAANFEGMTLDEMAALMGPAGTAERMRDAVEAAFGPLEREDDGRRCGSGSPRAASAVSRPPRRPTSWPNSSAARALEAAGNKSRAASLRSLS